MKNIHKKNIFLNAMNFPISFDMVQFDTGNQLHLTIKDMTIPSGSTAIAYYKKPSGKFVYDEKGISVSANVLIINVNNQCIAESGITYAQISIRNASDVVSTFGIRINVYPSYKDQTAEESKTVVNAFDLAVEEAIKKIGNILDKTLSIENKAADAGAVGAVLDIKTEAQLNAILDMYFSGNGSSGSSTGGITSDGIKAIVDAYLTSKNLSNYTLPMASANALGGVKANAKTAEYTIPVTRDASGFLWAKEIISSQPSTPVETPTESDKIYPSGDASGETDTAAIKAAMSAASANGGGTVNLSSGTFYIKEVLEPDECVVLNGDIRGESLSPSNVSTHKGTTIMAVADCDVIHLFKNGSGIRNMQILGYAGQYINFNQAYAIGSAPWEYGYKGYGIVYGSFDWTDKTLTCLIENITVQRCYRVGIVTATKTWCSFFDKIHIQRCGVGLLEANNASDNFFSNIQIENCGNGHMKFGASSSRYVNFKVFDSGAPGAVLPATKAGDSHGLYMTGSSNNMFSNYEVQETVGEGIRLDNSNWNSFVGCHVDAGKYKNNAIVASSYAYKITSSKNNRFDACFSTHTKKGLLLDANSERNIIGITAVYMEGDEDKVSETTDMGNNLILSFDKLKAVMA